MYDPDFVSSVTLFISLLCLSLHCTGVERTHICTYPCHAHACSFALRLSSVFVSLEWARLCHAKDACFHFILIVIARLLTDLRLDDLVYYYFTVSILSCTTPTNTTVTLHHDSNNQHNGLALRDRVILDSVAHWWVPARTPTVHWGPYARRPWVARQQVTTRTHNKNEQASSRLSLQKQVQSYCHLEIIHLRPFCGAVATSSVRS